MANDDGEETNTAGRRPSDLLPPPNLFSAEIPNLGPVIDPPFVDVPDFSHYLTPPNITPVDVEYLEPRISDESRREAADVALASEAVASNLRDKRYEVLEIGTRSLDRETDFPLVIIYDYTDDVVVEAMVDPARKAVLDVSVKRYQPPVTDAEHREALAILRAENPLSDAGIDLDPAVSLIVEDVNFQSPRFGHRVVDLRFGPADRYVPTAFAIVDLSNREVVKTGLIPREEASL
ncbi:hypothetical protein [Pseudarthrobacter sp. BIM B-2242]|uniref:hypothetical protein n=1 Tax=Pseudarthrobacter sp. BIM B-2242 TaxID=2772401 RepID=UPI00168B6A17|nr:hypothetical protein [Pseudarthrobacter sp. BIM B-2242]QOD02659.1 hypothetical protein IDT60_15055 [Pseudarthrobacter sp. BIM B-2242]